MTNSTAEYLQMDSIEKSMDCQFVLIGDMGVGKSSLINRFTDNRFYIDQPSTMGLDIACIRTKIGKDRIKLFITSTLGHRSQTSIIKVSSVSAAGVIFVYDVTSRKSFESLQYWMKAIASMCNKKAVVIVVGNKTDLADKREVTTKEGEEFAKRHGFLFMETSAKTGQNVPLVFLDSLKEIRLRVKMDLVLIEHKNSMEVAPVTQKSKKADTKKSKKAETKKEKSSKLRGIWSKILLYFS